MGDLGGSSFPAGVVVDDERSWAMAAHLSIMAGSVIPFGNLLGPLIVWLAQRGKSAFVVKHALEALAFQVGILAAIVALVILAVATLGVGLIIALPGAIGLVIANFVYMILGTMRANEGKIWEYPVTSRFVP